MPPQPGQRKPKAAPPGGGPPSFRVGMGKVPTQGLPEVIEEPAKEASYPESVELPTPVPLDQLRATATRASTSMAFPVGMGKVPTQGLPEVVEAPAKEAPPTESLELPAPVSPEQLRAAATRASTSMAFPVGMGKVPSLASSSKESNALEGESP